MISNEETTWKKLDAAVLDICRIAEEGLDGSEHDSECVTMAMHALAAFLTQRQLNKEELEASGGLLLGATVADCLIMCPTGFVVSPPGQRGPALWRVLFGAKNLPAVVGKFPLPLGTVTYIAAQLASEGTV